MSTDTVQASQVGEADLLAMNHDNNSKPVKVEPLTVPPQSLLAPGIWVQNIFIGSAVLVLVLCVGLIATAAGDIATGHVRNVAGMVGAITWLIGLSLAILLYLKTRLKERATVRHIREEQFILRCAKARAGLLTLADASYECQMTIADTKRALDRLVKLGVCQVDVSDDGDMIYKFSSLSENHQVELDH